MSKILAIDDKPDNLATLSALLNNLIPDCAVITAQSGAEGIEKAGFELPDVILLDIKMPDMDGFETCRRLKADESTKPIPVIMVTAIKTDPQSRVKGLEIGADAFLAKPIDQHELVSQVRVALRIKKAEDALREQRDSLERLVEERTRAIKESEERYRAIAEDMPVLICRFLPGGEITYVNDAYCRYFDKTSEALVGSSFQALIPGEDRETVMAGISALTVESPLQSHEHRVLVPDGETHRQRWTNRALFDDRGEVVAFQSIGEDITVRKEAEAEREKLNAQLKQAQKMESVGRLAGGVAHDFNNMLGVILGHLEFALEKAQEDNELTDDLNEIQKAAQRSADLTKQLLTFARKDIISDLGMENLEKRP